MFKIGRLSVSVLGFWALAQAAPAPVPTYSRDAAPIFYRSCVKCHRAGGIASAVPLSSWAAARPWAKAIRQKVLSREMPPWPADPAGSVRFRNDARLSRHDLDTLVAWVNGGAPQGNPADLPPAPGFTNGWMHPEGLEPDLVLSLPGPVRIPATGEIPYLKYLVKVPLTEDKWLAAVEARAGNPAVVHHMAMTEVRHTEGPGASPNDDPMSLLARQLGFRNTVAETQPAVTAAENPALYDMLAVYTPGSGIETFPEGSAKLLRGGSDLYIDFNIHYTAIGKPQEDRSMIALWFRSGAPKHQLFRVPGAGETILANGGELLTDTAGVRAEGTRVAIPPIPANAENYELTSVTAWPEPVTIYDLHPHAHFRARDFRYTVVYPDGRQQSVLSVPKYDFRWQLSYDLETPLRLPAGSKMIVTAHYDNSRNNPFNPAPDRPVYFRDQNQSWDEMFTPFIQYSLDDRDLTSSSAGQKNDDVLPTVQVVGCLRQPAPGQWVLAAAGDPSAAGQTTSSAAIKAAAALPLGNRQYRLLGVEVFGPAARSQQKVAVRGILLADPAAPRLNVTSLQTAGSSCSP